MSIIAKCTEQAIWSPDSQPDGKFCQSLSKQTRQDLAKMVTMIIKGEKKIVRKNIWQLFILLPQIPIFFLLFKIVPIFFLPPKAGGK